MSNESVEDLYSRIKSKHLEDSDKIARIDVQHPALRPTLRSYQIQAVSYLRAKVPINYISLCNMQCQTQWMLHRECIDSIGTHQIVYEKVHTKDGKTVHYNKYLGYFADENSNLVNYIYGISQSGILSDEMGLGKTIEVLSCILRNPKPRFDQSLDQFLKYSIDESKIEGKY